jgi:dolichol-phosphate mannosyltransferase
MKLTVLLPTKNEVLNIENLINRINKLNIKEELDILVIDDFSTDGTRELLGQLELVTPNLNIILRSNLDSSIASAYSEGYEWARKNQSTWVIQLDSDGQHDPDSLPKFIELINTNEYALIIGSRYCEGGKINGWSNTRKLISKSANLIFRLSTRSKRVKDATSGYRAIKLDLFLDKIVFESKYFSVHAELVKIIMRKNLSIIEVPIIFSSRHTGFSKMTTRSAGESLKLFAKWRFESVK